MKKSVFIQQLHNEADCKRKYFNVGLGINKRTGRLQWCPGSKIVRILIIIPATMLPILILFVLFTHLNIVGTTGINFKNYVSDREILNTQNNLLDNLEPRDPRCTAVRFGVSETLDAEERELLKDVRTSFIPPDLVMIPPNCKIGNEWISENENEVLIPDDENRPNEILFNHRKARRSVATTEAYYNKANKTELGSLEFEQEENDPQVPWKSMSSGTNSNSNHGNAELEEAEIPKPNDDGQYMSSIGYHAFWKGEGTAENIRKTQSEVMKQYMDLTVKPCDDFYQYACGNWEKLNPIPKDKAAYDTFEMLRESLDVVLKELLTDAKNPHVPIDTNNIDTKKDTNKSELTTKPPQGLSDLQNSLDSRLALRLRKRIIRRRSILNRMIMRYENDRRHRRELHHAENLETTDAEKKAKNLYESCMNYANLEKRGIEPLLDLLKALGGWPVLNPNWNEENFDWLNLTAQLRLFNNDIFIVEWVGPDIKNSEENVIQFDQTSLGLPTRDYFLLPTNLQYLDAYKEYMKTIITLLGANVENATQVANDMVEFEKELAKITSSPEERTNVSVLYKRMTVGSLHQQIPQIDWQKYLSIVLEHPINSSEVVVMFAMNYMYDLVKLLSQTESRTISNYLLWRFVRHRVNNLDDRFQNAKQKFYFVLFGREQSPPRWKNCVNQVNANMGMAVGAMFVRKYFDENSKKDTLTMTYELQQAFRELLNTTEWIDSPTKHLAELKVNAMSLRIGYPDYILAHDDLNDKYKDLSIDPTKYFENTLNVLLHLTRTEQSKLGQIVNKTAWHTAPAVVNAYYSRNKNQIMFPAGILQPPFYHRHFPKSLNYGGIGVVIGHELTHGFDDKGRLFDRDGNLHRWWSDSAIESFHERARCLIAQYGNYTVSEVGIAVDGENTQGENIADNGGIKQAFRAYQKWANNHMDEESQKNEILPNLNATNTQLFFLNFAQVWCGAMRPEATRNKLKTAVHSPGKFRVIGTLSNSDDFAREYNCPLGSPMNPQHKCSVW